LIYAPEKTAAATGATSAAANDAFVQAGAAYLSVPVDDYLQLPGVRAVTRVASSETYITIGGGNEEEGTFLAVDRATLASVVGPAWRADFAPESLGALMNRLAIDPSAALVSSDYARKQGLNVGDRIAVGLNDLGETHETPLVVAGTVDYFPTLFKEDGPFVIGNLEYSVEQQGAAYPFEIWLDMAPGADTAPVTAQGFGYGLIRAPETPEALLDADLLRPERQGLFGVLSVGFLSAVLVTVLGFLAHTLRSFQRRLVELGMLRAIGLGTGQLMSMLIYEQAAVLGVGVGIGMGLGVLASRLFVPFLQVRAVEYPDTPPFVVQIAWSEIAIVCTVAVGLLVCVVAFTLAFLRRMRLFEVVKLGEAV
jgi:putative ABC transport system permease protein